MYDVPVLFLMSLSRLASELAKTLIQIDAESIADDEDLHAYLPRLLIVVRDFKLKYVAGVTDDAGMLKEKLSYSANECKSTNKVTRDNANFNKSLHVLYPEMKCITIPMPSGDTAILNTLDVVPYESLNKDFQTKMNQTVALVKELALSKVIPNPNPNGLEGSQFALDGPVSTMCFSFRFAFGEECIDG